MEHAELTEKVIGCAMKVHRALGPGFLEVVYRNALAHELRRAGVQVECERKIQVRYDGVVVGDFAADMLVEGCVVIEIKAVRVLAPAHELQLVHYLTATGIDVGLLLNFGAGRLQFKRKARIYRPQAKAEGEPVVPDGPAEGRQDEQDGQDGGFTSATFSSSDPSAP